MIRKSDAALDAWFRFADAVPAPLFVAAASGSVVAVNASWRALFGEPIPGMPWFAALHPADGAGAARDWLAAVASREPFDAHLRFRRRTGGVAWAHVRAAVEDDERVERFFGIVEDTDGSRRAEDEMRAILRSMPQIVWTADASGSIDWYNERWYEYTGQTRAEAAGWGWQAVHHPEDFPSVMQRWPHSIATGEPFEMEFRLRGMDGRFRWFLTRIQPVRDDAGEIVRWYGSNTEIEEQVRTIARTQRISETLQDVFLPTSLPQPSDVRFDAMYVSAERGSLVGGDWYDAFELPDGRLAFSIGDVMGHGLAASVTVGRLRQAIFTLAFDEDDPAVVLSKLNNVLRRQEETIATAIVGFVSHDRRTIRYANAGHPPAIVASPGEAPTFLEYGDVPLGVLDGLTLATREIANVKLGTLVVLYTDGITEFARDIDAAEEKLLAAVASRVGDVTSARPARTILAEVLGGGVPSDDAALLFMQFDRVAADVREADDAAQLSRKWRYHSSDSRSAMEIRRTVIAYLRRIALPESELGDAELVLGELLANTVEHAPGLVEIDLDWSGRRPRLIVSDSGDAIETNVAGLPDDPFDENGRGLYLVHALARDIDTSPAPDGGNCIRFTLDIDRGEEPVREGAP